MRDWMKKHVNYIDIYLFLLKWVTLGRSFISKPLSLPTTATW